MASITFRAGDTAPNLPIVCTRSGSAIDLTGATVRLIISNSSGTRMNTGHNTATITNATGGLASYDVVTGDFPTADTYTADTEITYANGEAETQNPSQIIVVTAKN